MKYNRYTSYYHHDLLLEIHIPGRQDRWGTAFRPVFTQSLDINSETDHQPIFERKVVFLHTVGRSGVIQVLDPHSHSQPFFQGK